MQADGNSTSFLDVMACALGGMAMLFLILSVMPHSGEPVKTESKLGAESPIPTRTPTSQGKAGIKTPVLVRISHPYCKVDAGTDLENPNELPDARWAALDNTESGRRVGVLRISPSGNTIVEFRECQQSGDITAEYLFHPTLVGTLERFEKRELKYSDGKLR